MIATPRPVAVPSLRAVARACGVSPTAVYRHFTSQDDLTRAVLASEHEVFERAVLAADDPGSPPQERLRQLVGAYARWGVAHPGVYQLLFESGEQLQAGAAVAGASDQLVRHVSDLVRAHRGSAATEDEAALAGERLWRAAHGLVSLRIHKPDHPWLTDLAAEVRDVVDRGL